MTTAFIPPVLADRDLFAERVARIIRDAAAQGLCGTGQAVAKKLIGALTSGAVGSTVEFKTGEVWLRTYGMDAKRRNTAWIARWLVLIDDAEYPIGHYLRDMADAAADVFDEASRASGLWCKYADSEAEALQKLVSADPLAGVQIPSRA
jgi:hypothetical protein